jgi:hypothetical protein
MNNNLSLSFLGETPKDKLTTILIFAIIGVVGYFLAKKLYVKVLGIINQQKYSNELDNELIKGKKLSYSENLYQSYANKLYAAMKGLGTDEKAIFAVFNAMNNKADLLKILTVFGTRDNMSLNEWIYDDLSLSDINKINTILANKGIEYSF